MNEIAKIEQSAVILPRNMEEASRLADLMASAKLVPAALQKSPADCLLVIMQAMRWRMDVFAVAQECSVIQGKLMYSGKLVAAVINSLGGLTDRLSFHYDGEGDQRAITVAGRLYGETEPRTVAVRIKDARTANKVWQTQPDQQLMYHGSRVWARRHAPELMLGVYSPEEFDPVHVDAAAKRPSPPKPSVLLPPHNPETGEIRDDDLPTAEDVRGILAPPSPRQDEIDHLIGDAALKMRAREAAMNGAAALTAYYNTLPSGEKKILRSMKSELEQLYPTSDAEAET